MMAKKKQEEINLVHLMAVAKLHQYEHISRIPLCPGLNSATKFTKLTIFREELAKSSAADFTVLRAIAKFTNFTSLLRF